MSKHRVANWLSGSALLVLGTFILSSCQDPTEITLEITTDVSCSDLTETSIAAGKPLEIQNKDPATVTNRCSGGRIGSLVVTPAAGNEDDVAIRVVTGVGKSADACVRDHYEHQADDQPGTGCIVARRELAYVEHKPLLLPVLMEQDCINIPCEENRTCVGGRCVSAKVTCAGDRCGLSPELDGGGGTGGADAGPSTGGAGGTGGTGGTAGSGGVGGTGGSEGGLDSSPDREGGDAGDSGACGPAEVQLSALSTSEGAVTPIFDSCTRSYSLTVDLVVQAITVSATTMDSRAEVRVNGTLTASGTPSTPVTLSLGTNSIPIVVKSPAGVSTTYTLEVDRANAVLQSAYAKAPASRANDFFGWRVALSDNTLAVGKSFQNLPVLQDGGLPPLDDGGRVYVFVRSGATWTQQTVLAGSNTEPGDLFGISVAISGDTIAVGAEGESSNATGINGTETNNAAAKSGATYIFLRSGTTWKQQAYIKASNTGAADVFGGSVALSGDALVVGARGEASSAKGINGLRTDNSAPGSGAAYVFTRTGSVWSEEAYVKASNTQANDAFGGSVAMSGDTFVVGAPGEASNAKGVNFDQSDNSASGSGAAYVFVRSGSIWAQQAYVKASNTESGDSFGTSTALSGDTLAIGAYTESSSSKGVNGNQGDNSALESGAAYVFVRSGTAWTQQAYLKASNTDASDNFGLALALSGEALVVGAPGESSAATGLNGNQNDNSLLGSGAAYLFIRSGATWKQQAYIKASNAGKFDSFGISAAFSMSAFAVGAFGESSSASGVNGNGTNDATPNSGAVYVFQ